jgi:hypothetical protein
VTTAPAADVPAAAVIAAEATAIQIPVANKTIKDPGFPGSYL